MSVRIYTTEDSEVREISSEVPTEEILSESMQNFFDELIDAMIRFEGIGIAACQIGKTIRVFAISREHSPTQEHLVLVNPRIVSASKKTLLVEEGCLSVPGMFGPIERPMKVRVKALQRNAKPIDIKAKGMLARILQHEHDHLNGTLYIDSALYTTDRRQSALEYNE